MLLNYKLASEKETNKHASKLKVCYRDYGVKYYNFVTKAEWNLKHPAKFKWKKTRHKKRRRRWGKKKINVFADQNDQIVRIWSEYSNEPTWLTSLCKNSHKCSYTILGIHTVGLPLWPIHYSLQTALWALFTRYMGISHAFPWVIHYSSIFWRMSILIPQHSFNPVPWTHSPHWNI